jgi:hypothetical protein
MFFAALPGVADRLPGVPVDYLPTQAALQCQELHSRMAGAAWTLLGLLLLVAFAAHQLQLLGKLNLSPHHLVLRFLLLAVLLANSHLVFGAIFAVGHGFAGLLFQDVDFTALNKQIHDAAQARRDASGGGVTGFFDTVAGVLSVFTPVAGAMDLVRALASIGLLVVGIIFQLVWRALVMVLFIASPLCVVLGMIPGFGQKILSAWFGALVQVSAWQVWGAMCAWMVKSADGFFTLQKDLATGQPGFANDAESVAVSILFVILYAACPAVVGKLFPISGFSALASTVTSGFGAIVGAGVSVAKMAVGGAVGGPLGAAVAGGVLPAGLMKGGK